MDDVCGLFTYSEEKQRPRVQTKSRHGSVGDRTMMDTTREAGAPLEFFDKLFSSGGICVGRVKERKEKKKKKT